MFKNKKKRILWIILIVIGAIGIMIGVYYLPPVHSRLAWRVAILRGEIYYFFNPPDQEAFTPAQQAEMDAIVQQTLTAMLPVPTATLEPSSMAAESTLATENSLPTQLPTITLTNTPVPTAIPDKVRLLGVRHEFETYNNCGPATISMALSYWGWDGNQVIVGNELKPNWRDLNVMPYELVDYVETQTEFEAIERYGGDIDLLKHLIAAGFPVVIERGYQEEVPDKGWVGHYSVITAYDDEEGWFLLQDPFAGEDYANTYERVERHWQAFNYLYIVVYPADRESEVLSILGSDADETANLQHAAEKAQNEIYTLEDDRQLFFAWYNYGTSLMYLADYYGAAQAYDQAFTYYPDLSPRPWRMLWYQTGPYFAYYWTGRYQDVIDLANKTIDDSSEPAIEESWVWLGRAKYMIGDTAGAIKAYRTALEWHPDWWVAKDELVRLGETP